MVAERRPGPDNSTYQQQQQHQHQQYGSTDSPVRIVTSSPEPLSPVATAHTFPPRLPPPSPSLPIITSKPTAATTGSIAHGSSKLFFKTYHRSKSASRLHPDDATTVREVAHPPTPIRSVPGRVSVDPHQDQVYRIRQGVGSSPDIPPSNKSSRHDPTMALGRSKDEPKRTGSKGAAAPPATPAAGTSSKSDSSMEKAKRKPRPFAHFLGRTRSVRTESAEPTPRTSGPHQASGSEHSAHKVQEPSLKTAPLHEGDRSFREMMASTIRNRSADRQPSAGSENGAAAPAKENSRPYMSASSSLRDGTGSVLTSLKNSSTRAADGLGKAGKGFFGKLGRRASSTERDRDTVTDENYVCRVINLPLVEQTRRTRISKRLEDSRDKTEFWMPALPWRCIDYLNFKGCEEEGLYRIPGSGVKVKQWQRRFDTELDINLFDEPDLYDINIIGSMFKAWLRELPDEIFPKATQARIAEKCMGATEVPQMLKDELSKLQPYNYYLLFAITCHLSLLHSHVEQNKMDYRNLCICFQPCLKMDGFCFHFLVCEWKHCWQGCWTEKEALAIEYGIMEGLPPSSAGGSSTVESSEPVDERTVSSSESSKPPSFKPHAFRPLPAAGTFEQSKRAPSIETCVEEEFATPAGSTCTPPPDEVEPAAPEENETDNATPVAPRRPPPLAPLVPLSPLHI